ncbi:MAG: ribosome biosis GTPase / thiamine phosphate phosphatase [Gaiellales bacterium]|nr:ribosome biosis GTPase / thiamine phosphate phosphatase [Gaiellales bacterium]
MSIATWWPADADATDIERLRSLGWDDERNAEAAALDLPGTIPGRIARVDRGVCTVFAASGSHRAAVLPRFGTPAVGDWALFTPAVEGGDDATLRALLERRTSFSRHTAGEETLEQVVASNVDVVLLLNALDQRFSLRRIERYLTLGWQSGARPVIVFTKADVSDEVERIVLETEAVAYGTDILTLSSVTGQGLEQLDPYLTGNHTVALLGLSGAGKSTLINRLAGNQLLRTQEVRDDGRGRHTTTHRELIPLLGGGVLVDTPGMRSIGLWGEEEGLEQAFSDVEELAAGCRFADCKHETEPGCAVLEAIEQGTLPAARLESYTKLLRELRHQAVKQDKRAQSEQRKHWRSMNKAMRSRPQHDR